MTIHLLAQATVEFTAEQLWPHHGEYARFGTDLASFAEEVSRRLQTEGCVGCAFSADEITIIPVGSIERIDFTQGSS